MSFEDIAIVDLDLAKTTWSRVHSSMRTLYLRLSREPEFGWIRFFQDERESRVVIKRHGFWIEDGYIVFDCLLEDVERFHLPDFRQSVEYANRKFRAYLEHQHERGMLLREDARSERVELAALRERIRQNAAPPVGAQAPNPNGMSAKGVPAALARAAAAVPRDGIQPVPPAPSPEPEPAAPEPRAVVDAPVRSNDRAARVAALLHNDAPVPVPVVAEPEPPAAPIAQPPAGAASAGETLDPDFNAKREEWRARFRAALAAQSKEHDRGND